MDDEACVYCECNPCDCGWGEYYGPEKGNIDTIFVSDVQWWGHDWNDLTSSLASSWSHYNDCLEHVQELYGAGGFPGNYPGAGTLMFNVGDLVRYFPNSDFTSNEGLWIVKSSVNKHSLDCSWYDYEITNGSVTIMCRQEEIFTLEAK